MEFGMRKSLTALLILLFLFIPVLFLYAEDEPAQYVTEHNFMLTGYFRPDLPANSPTVEFDVFNKDSSIDRIFQSGSVIFDDSGSNGAISLSGETTVFNWKLIGRNFPSGQGIQVRITIKPLQAFETGKYYIPQHTYRFYHLETDAQTGTPVYVQETAHSFSKTPQSGNYPYSGYVTYPQKRENNKWVDDKENPIYETADWVDTFYPSIGENQTIGDIDEYGKVTLIVEAYDITSMSGSAAEFTYISYVTVEFSAI